MKGLLIKSHINQKDDIEMLSLIIVTFCYTFSFTVMCLTFLHSVRWRLSECFPSQINAQQYSVDMLVNGMRPLLIPGFYSRRMT